MDERTKIMEGLRTLKDGKLPIDDVMKTSQDCPRCGTVGTPEDKKLVVDRETLTFKTKCCGINGGPVSYLQIMRGIPAEKALKILKGII